MESFDTVALIYTQKDGVLRAIGDNYYDDY